MGYLQYLGWVGLDWIGQTGKDSDLKGLGSCRRIGVFGNMIGMKVFLFN